MLREALAMDRKLLGNEHAALQGPLANLAVVLSDQGKLAEAESMSREALAMGRKLLGNEYPNVADSLNNLVLVLIKESKLAEAEPLQREALAMDRKLLGNEHPSVARSLNNLALVLENQGKLPEAEAMDRETLAMNRKLLGNEHPAVATSLHNLAVVLYKQGKLPEAEPIYREALAMDRKLLGDEHPDVRATFQSLLNVLLREGKYRDAEELVNAVQAPALENRAQSLWLLRFRAYYFARRSQWKEALADQAKALELDPADPKRYHAVAALLVATGDLEAYRRHCQRMLARFSKTTDPTTADIVVKDCLILPFSGADLGTVSELAAQLAVTIGTNHAGLSWLQFAKGLAEYRQGRFASAADWMRQTLGGGPP
jgi:tetratricopeptide (TPR) repeat protein